MSKYQGSPEFQHDRQPSLGILLVNLGTPDAPTASAVRRYLAEFLSDPRVVEAPRWLWWLILHGIILRIRPAKVARNYQHIWTEQGSPLLSYTQSLADKIQQSCQSSFPGPVHIKVAMRYGNPSIAHGLRALRDIGAERILILPLYPQYSATTTASIFDAVSKEFQRWRWIPDWRMCMHYHDHPSYIDAIAEQIRPVVDKLESDRPLMFSFHGLPKRYLLAGDPYFCHCESFSPSD